MSQKILKLKHHLSSGCCMWTSMEDVYTTKTNQDVPDAYLLGMSSLAETVLLKMHDGPSPYMLGMVDARPHKTYASICDLLGMKYHITSRSTPQAAFKIVKKEIDNGNPVILGPLDMYYLPYFKMYHKYHIPIHYITMIGYDEENDSIYIYDCDRIEMIKIPVSALFEAWQVENSSMGKKNGFVLFSMADSLPDKYTLAQTALVRKADRQLCEKPSFVGINAFKRIAKLLPEWEKNETTVEYKRIIAGLTQFLGKVPQTPNRILGVPMKDTMPYQANYDRFGSMLVILGNESNHDNWVKAGNLFTQAGKIIEEIKECMVSFYCDDIPCTKQLVTKFLQVHQLSEQAYLLLKEYR